MQEFEAVAWEDLCVLGTCDVCVIFVDFAQALGTLCILRCLGCFFHLYLLLSASFSTSLSLFLLLLCLALLQHPLSLALSFANLCDSFKPDATRRNLSCFRCCCFFFCCCSSCFCCLFCLFCCACCCCCCLGCANRRVNSLPFVFASSGCRSRCCFYYCCLFFCFFSFFATLSFFIV